MTRLCWLNTTYACGGLILDENDRIVKTCPIYKWMRKNHIDYVLQHLYRKRTFLEIACFEEEI